MRRLLFACLALTLSLEARELHWQELSVKAHLEADGTLRVDEKQVMVFTGDWNGGERIFDVRPRQSLSLSGIGRIDPATGEEIALAEGSLDEVDRFGWNGNTVRWRSRKASDPPFNDTVIPYVLHYTLSNILADEGELYVLHHDFAFPQRQGPIVRFTLDLTFDDWWQPSGNTQRHYTAGPLAPGDGFVLKIPLRYSGTGAPATLHAPLPYDTRRMLQVLLVVPPLLFAFVLLREKMVGRLKPIRPEAVSRVWLEQHVLRVRPEKIGAIWDDEVGPAEVAATLARLVGEQKLTSRVSKGGELHMTLRVPREQFTGYERALIDGLFFHGDSTSTPAIRTEYSDRGFRPAELIAKGLLQDVEAQLPKGKPIRVWTAPLVWLLWLGGAAALVHAVAVKGDTDVVAAAMLFIAANFAGLFALLAPTRWRRRKDYGFGKAIASMIVSIITTGIAAYLIRKSAFPEGMLLGLTVLALWVFALAAHSLRTRGDSRESLAFRQMLTAAREYFRRELRTRHPALDDQWYPYVLAFGLDSDVQRWFRDVAGATHHGHRETASSAGAASAPQGSGWTGGGGAFGGAGATGTWAAAATAMAVGVASASSSSGSSGGGGSSSSGGSSGGGGGGGW